VGKSGFSIARKDAALEALVMASDKRTLGIWAKACAERVLHYFETAYPNDMRPRHALDTLQAWIESGVFKMAIIRKASLDSHAAARGTQTDEAAWSAARAAGQAVATAHVARHSLGAANYALQAIYRATESTAAEAAVAVERAWQYQHLAGLGTEQGDG